jgi:hypothetical protein
MDAVFHIGGLDLILPKSGSFSVTRADGGLSLAFANFTGQITLRPSAGGLSVAPVTASAIVGRVYS